MSLRTLEEICQEKIQREQVFADFYQAIADLSRSVNEEHRRVFGRGSSNLTDSWIRNLGLAAEKRRAVSHWKKQLERVVQN